ncbi:MAG: glycoside hydrolase family 2 TIM barrel-domain containing protein [Woeseiaceae bacterium]
MKPIPVEVRQTADGWQLFRGGEPYLIRGVGGDGDLSLLVASGGNSLRTWGADDIGATLDEAHRLGLSVTVGIWLGHERHGFDYSDQQAVDEQLAYVRKTVLRYRDHPAVLIWALGNEMEGFADGDNPLIWKAVNDAAALVKALDPNHPTMTVTAEIGGRRVEFVHEQCDAIDIHGINSYGGAVSLPERLRTAKASKPYIVTEFGPVGPWEVGKTAWDAPYEATSAEKANQYDRAYTTNVLDNSSWNLGSYAFLWSSKMEGTETWFGMFLRDGEKLSSVDTMTRLWGGENTRLPSPEISEISLSVDPVLAPNQSLEAGVSVLGSESELSFSWRLLPEAGELLTGGDFRADLPPVENAIVAADGPVAKLRMPEYPGAYRLFVLAKDEHGNAATANMPLLVEGIERQRFPVTVYHDGFGGMPWSPSGWMGDNANMKLDGEYEQVVHTGRRAIRFRYEGRAWGAIAWQHPANDWGDLDGGFSLEGARFLEVTARGEYGGERVKFGVGLLGNDKPYADSVIVEHDEVVLTSDWQTYRINLAGKDLSRIKTAFVVSVVGRATPVTVYMDGIRFDR